MIYSTMFGAPIEQFDGSQKMIDKYGIHFSQSVMWWVPTLFSLLEFNTHYSKLEIGDWIVDLGKEGFAIVGDERSKELIKKARKEEPMHVTFKTTSTQKDADRNE